MDGRTICLHFEYASEYTFFNRLDIRELRFCFEAWFYKSFTESLQEKKSDEAFFGIPPATNIPCRDVVFALPMKIDRNDERSFHGMLDKD